MSKWAYSLLATRFDPEGRHLIRHAVGLVAAASRDEAMGKAMRIILKIYPLIDGWKNHHVLVQSTDDATVEPENTRIVASN